MVFEIVIMYFILLLLLFYFFCREKPVRDNDDNEIEEPKIIQDNIDYNAFSKRVQYIILTERSYEFRAARTIITAPDIEEGCRNITTIDNDIHVGMIGEHPVGLIQCNNEKDYADTLKNAIIKWFPNADYLVAVGVCTGFNCDKTSFADVLISNKIIVFEIGETGKEVKYSHEAIEMMPEIKRIFCSNPNKVDGKKVATNDRRAKHLVGKIASHPILFQSKRLMDLTQVYRKTYGGDLHSGELVSLQRNGIKMEDKSERSVQVMVIKAVSVYTDKKEQKDNWQDIGARAAFNYVKCKMILQPSKLMSKSVLTKAMVCNYFITLFSFLFLKKNKAIYAQIQLSNIRVYFYPRAQASRVM